MVNSSRIQTSFVLQWKLGFDFLKFGNFRETCAALSNARFHFSACVLGSMEPLITASWGSRCPSWFNKILRNYPLLIGAKPPQIISCTLSGFALCSDILSFFEGFLGWILHYYAKPAPGCVVMWIPKQAILVPTRSFNRIPITNTCLSKPR